MEPEGFLPPIEASHSPPIEVAPIKRGHKGTAASLSFPSKQFHTFSIAAPPPPSSINLTVDFTAHLALGGAADSTDPTVLKFGVRGSIEPNAERMEMWISHSGGWCPFQNLPFPKLGTLVETLFINLDDP